MPPPEKITTPEKAKGHSEYGAIFCIAPKKGMGPFDAYINELVCKGELTVLARTQESRARLWRSYERVKILYAAADKINLDEKITSGLDYVTFTRKIPVVIGLSSYNVVDMWLKWNIKEHSSPFQLRGGIIDIKEEKSRNNADEVVRICHYTLKGELGLAFHCLDHMLEKELADPATITYALVDTKGG